MRYTKVPENYVYVFPLVCHCGILNGEVRWKRSGNKMEKEFYVDGVGQIHFAGNMVRFDMVTLQPGAEGQAPTPEPAFRVIMPPQGFLAAFNSMQQLIDKLVAAGVLRKNENAQQ